MTLLSDVPRLASADLDAYWMPFTANRQFKSAPRMFVKAEGMYYTTDDGRQVLDGFAGLWCCNAGHCRPGIVAAIQAQAAEMDYAPAFQMGHPLAFGSPIASWSWRPASSTTCSSATPARKRWIAR